ncbi:HIT family protein [Aestuariivirga litoralis]|uniref:HIT family protein n=1 Tax=Aestuariivirga litoralis TaxID=2650924 RepID=A0A2W2C4Z2_9HYPH|nr:HIT family protein [Aestuariivirga litoralis]PZF75233.1 HIT family protein [Aestuariivirga litoralis]
MSYDTNNIFAKILRGEIPCHKVYEDEHTLAFMDVMPQADGHTLVIPKMPSRNLLDADPRALGALMAAVQKVANAAKQAFGAEGVLIQQFNESAAGQTVFHLHVHILPRHGGVALRPHTGKMADHAMLAEQAARIRAALGG